MNASDRPPVAALTTSLNGPTMLGNASGSSDPDAADSLGGSPYFWDFGDGSTGRGTTVRHKYAAQGSYAVSVYVTDLSGATDVVTHTVKVTNPRPAPTHSFSAKYTINIDQIAFGLGNATGMGSSAMDSFGLTFDATDFPRSFTFFVDSGVLVQVSDTSQQIYAPYMITLTDVADPPTGINYQVSGTYTFQGGQGRYFSTTGAGTITGTCVSAFNRSDADCVLTWKGTIGG